MQLRQLTIMVAVLVVGTTIATTNEESSRAALALEANNPVWVDNNCGHPRDTRDAKRVSKRAWSRAYGPNKSDRANYKTLRKCAKNPFLAEDRFPALWQYYKGKLASDRHLLRLNKECQNQPTSAVIRCIKYASLVHSFSLSTLYRIAYCESHLNPSAGNPSGASGLFQFMPSTFATTPYANESIFSAKYSSLAAAWYMSRHGTSAWVCQ